MAVAVTRGSEILWEEGFGWIDRPGGTAATAGLTTYDSRDQISGDETIRRYGVVFWRPGDRFDYSNLGFGILGKVISDVSGRSFQAFVHDELLRPLAMANAWAGATPNSQHPVAPRYP